ncbi:MAG: hypothetical protein IKY39_03350 [Clostridia bacterium]|nr:hypothetical protein [Clostridia bacterium]
MKFENNPVTIEVNDNIYTLPARTLAVEDKIKAHDEKIPERNEFENNKELIEILIGKKAFKEIFPDGKNSNLDHVAMVAFACLETYYKPKTDADYARAQKSLEKLQTIQNAVKKKQ